MNVDKEIWNLSDFVLALAHDLKQMGLETQTDRRASALPDARAVRYYTSLGLLDPPLIQARKAHYHAGHKEQVLLIKLLQARGLSLQQIQQQYYGISARERQTLLHNLKQDIQVPEPVALLWQEYQLAPGLRLQIFDDLQGQDLEVILKKVEGILKKRGTNHDTSH